MGVTMPNLTYNHMLSAYEAYPSPIRPYLLRAETHPELREALTKSFMRVFIDLVSRTRIRKPEKEISVSVKAVAAKLDVSSKTVTRTISFCLDRGWLAHDPSHDGRNRWGKYAAKRYLVCDSLRELLGLPTALQSLSHDSSDASSDKVGQPNAALPAPDERFRTRHNDDRQDENETEMSHGIRVNNCLSKKEASFNNEADKPKGLPADLRPLQRELGISLFGIFSLMRLAKQVGQRLQDVWTVKRELLVANGIKAGRAVHYIRSLLQSGDDFAYVARKRTAGLTGERPTVGGRTETNGRLIGLSTGARAIPDFHAIAEASKHKRFQHVSRQMSVRIYDGFAEVTIGAVRETYVGDQMIGLYKGIAAGNLVEARE